MLYVMAWIVLEINLQPGITNLYLSVIHSTNTWFHYLPGTVQGAKESKQSKKGLMRKTVKTHMIEKGNRVFLYPVTLIIIFHYFINILYTKVK